MGDSRESGVDPNKSVETSIERIRDYIDHRLNEADRLYQMRYDFTDKALTSSQEANNDRLNTMDAFRVALSEQAARMPTRTEVETLIDSARRQAVAQIAPIQVKVDALGKPNIALIAAIAGVLFSVVSAGWVIIGLKIDSTNLPVEVAIQAVKTDTAQLGTRMAAVEIQAATSTQADTASKSDRAQLNDRLKSTEIAINQSSQADSVSRADRSQLNTRIASVEEASRTNTTESRANAAATSAKLTEVETQFRMLSDILNLDKDQNQRLFGLLWKKSYPGIELPPSNFRPQISNNN